MKKVIRLTESDLKRIIMKVLQEDVDTGAGGKLDISNGNLVFKKGNQSCAYEVYNKKTMDKQYFTGISLIKGWTYDDYQVQFKNSTGCSKPPCDHTNKIPKVLANGFLSDGFNCKSEFEASLLGYGGLLKRVS